MQEKVEDCERIGGTTAPNAQEGSKQLNNSVVRAVQGNLHGATRALPDRRRFAD
jgi:hypothetical protein